MLIIFDLDGTLIDSSKDLAISMNAMRQHVGMPALDPSLIFSYVGNGAAVLVQKALGPDASDELNEHALEFFMNFYRAHAIENTHLYPGIRELIDGLFEADHKLAVLTNKPARISVDIVAALGLTERFVAVYGGNSLPAKKPDPIGIFTLMSESGVRVDDTLMVGDSAVDVQTARNARVRSCGVLWGFQPEAFETDPPDFLLAEPRDLLLHLR